MAETIFVSGIDTDAGKSFATGYIARRLMEAGRKVVTQKFIQTGCDGYSEDIEIHRRIMGSGEMLEDIERLTAPIIFTYPASAQLAARIDGREIDLSVIDNATRRLSADFDTILIEGAGGLMVPITDDFFAIDYAATRGLPIALVTNSRLGSINHTVLSLEAIKSRGLKLHSVWYNTFFDKDPEISRDTREFIARHVEHHFPGTEVIDIPVIALND